MNKSLFFNALRSWLPLACGLTLVCGLIYVAVQQNYRLNADEPQIRVAQDAAAVLSTGVAPERIIPPGTIDMSVSLAPFMIVYDDTGKQIYSNVTVRSLQPPQDVPVPPSGAFDYARKNGENRVTWQPFPGVRNATVIVRYEGQTSGFVLAARSLREVEKRQTSLAKMVGLGWLAALLGTLAVTLGMEFVSGRSVSGESISAKSVSEEYISEESEEEEKE